MPTIYTNGHGAPQKPTYPSVKAYLMDLAKDVAILVDDPTIMKRFREQLRLYNKMCTEWITAETADREERWEPSMGKPEYPWNVFDRTFNLHGYDNEKEAKVLSGSYSLLAFTHDRELPHLENINNGIVLSSEVIEQTLAAPGNMIEGHFNQESSILDEITLIEEHYNRVRVDIKECIASRTVESDSEKVRKAQELDRVAQLSDVELFEYVASLFKKRDLKVLAKDETWLSLDRSVKPWFEIAIERLKQTGKEKKIGLLQYCYKNLLYRARNINIKSFRGSRDWRLLELASKQANELGKELERIAESLKEAKQEPKPIAEPVKREVPWNTNDKAFLEASKAIQLAEHFNRKIALPQLSIKLKPDGPVTYMRLYTKDGKPRRCRVHICEFLEFLQGLPKIKPDGNDITDEALEEYMADVWAKKEETKTKKRRGK